MKTSPLLFIAIFCTVALIVFVCESILANEESELNAEKIEGWMTSLQSKDWIKCYETAEEIFEEMDQGADISRLAPALIRICEKWKKWYQVLSKERPQEDKEYNGIPKGLEVYQASLVYGKLIDILVKTDAYVTEWKASNVFSTISIGAGIPAVSIQLGKENNIGLFDSANIGIAFNYLKKAYRRGNEEHFFAFWVIAFGMGASKPTNDNGDIILNIFFVPWGMRIDNVSFGIGLQYKAMGKLETGWDNFSLILPSINFKL